MSQNIVQRSANSLKWNVGASTILIMSGLVRSITLARLLPIEVFGIFAWAYAIINISGYVANLGLGSAFMHRAPETEDEERAAAVQFTLKMLLVLIWFVIMVILAFALTSDPAMVSRADIRTALVVLAVCEVGLTLADTHRAILTRRIMHRRLAVAQVVGDVISTLLMISLALQGVTLWVLLAGAIIKVVVDIFIFLFWRPVWKMRLAWSGPIVRYFIHFGVRAMTARLLQEALDRVDDLWTGVFLGNVALGFYSQAYTFAVYPRSILASPIYLVAAGTYAELKGKRNQLSQAFFQVSGILVRSSFFLAGLIMLCAPEFIRIFLGARWLPMLDAFRLMLIFTLFDPLLLTTATLFIALGKPETIVRARVVQIAVMVLALFLLGLPFGIAGVALAVDIMLMVGIAILFWRARHFVDFSIRQLLLAPIAAFVMGVPLALIVGDLPGIVGSDWRTWLAKAVVFSGIYVLALLLLEWRQINTMRLLLMRHLVWRSESP